MCRGDELRLIDCPSDLDGSDCSHKVDVGIRCQGQYLH